MATKVDKIIVRCFISALPQRYLNRYINRRQHTTGGKLFKTFVSLFVVEVGYTPVCGD